MRDSILSCVIISQQWMVNYFKSAENVVKTLNIEPTCTRSYILQFVSPSLTALNTPNV